MLESVKDDSEILQSQRDRFVHQYPWTIGHDESLSEYVVYSVSMRHATTRPRHPWLGAVVGDLRALLALRRGWDSYDASPISARAIERASDVVNAIAATEAPRPAVVPTSTGGVQLEWLGTGIELQLEIEPDNDELTVSLRNVDTGAWWHGRLGDEPEPLEKVLWRLSTER